MWRNPPANLTLGSHDVHLWQANLDLYAVHNNKFTATLSTDEQARANRFYFEQDKQRFIAGRGILREILSRYINIEPAQLQFEYGSRGKPRLVTSGDRIEFNLSHSQGLVLYGISRHPIGVDLEYLRSLPDAAKMAQRFFCPPEYEHICTFPPQEQQQAFFRIWTAKEAYLKATGDGLARLEQVEVSVDPSPLHLTRIAGDAQAASQWTLHHLSPAANAVATIAVADQDWQLQCWQFDS